MFSCYPSSHGKFFSNELSLPGRLRRALYRKPSTRLGFRVFDLAVTFTLCLVYVIRVELDDYISYQCGGLHCSVSTIQLPKETDTMAFSSNAINWYLLLWVRRPFTIWIIQMILSSIWFFKGILTLYISPKGTRLRRFWYDGLLLDWLCTLPHLLTVCYKHIYLQFVPALRNLFLPGGFLACWLVRRVIQNLLNDLHLTKQRCQATSVTFKHELTLLLITMSCLIFTTMCGIQHIQRGSSGAELTMFESFYFVIVTFSTVGYGDISPDTWLGQLFMTCMIGIAFAFIPRQVEGFMSAFKDVRKTGGEYSQSNARGKHHVVLCTTSISAESMLYFLIEFYAHPQLEDHTVVLLSTEQREASLRILLKDPKWAYRVIYMQGSALNDVDLERCRMADADACFILLPAVSNNNNETDQLTLMYYWAVKDFAPHCRQYIKIYKQESKLHIYNEDHVVCGDELKFSILANNCLHPGLSSFITLLVHSSTVEVSSLGTEPWQQLYGRHSSHALFHIQLNQSKMFQRYRGWSFTLASADAHKRYGVGLIAVQDRTRHDSRLHLNPGDGYKLRDYDCLFYMADVPEERGDVLPSPWSVSTREYVDNDQLQALNNNSQQQGIDSPYNNREPGIVSSPWEVGLQQCCIQDGINSSPSEESSVIGPPPSSSSTINHSTRCHVMKTRRPDCCLQWGKDCDHCAYKNARHNLYGNQLIILAAEESSAGMMNFFVPLRSHIIAKDEIKPIVVLLGNQPNDVFLETIAYYPLIFWIQGSISSIDDLIKSGIHRAAHLVVPSMQFSSVTDSDVLVAVRTIQRLFPFTNVITELSQASNIRFINSRNSDTQTLPVAKLERRLKEKMSSTLPNLFHQHFAAGKVFSVSLLDSMLYQTFVKRYLINFVRLLIGIETENNAGYLSSIRVNGTASSTYTTFGELYYGLASSSGNIPLAIYRTEKPLKTAEPKFKTNTRRTNDYVHGRLKSLGMDTDAYVLGLDQERDTDISYVIPNPTPETKLLDGDVVYVLLPGNFIGHPPPTLTADVTRTSASHGVHV
ncbi:potassium channel subfamily T member 1-like [Ylistrum balloti]|uniref:potassium channel subfamily T member 1-like n=1 Tax=Ylistrum balloti TaxID=509963 RepID=UPI0029057F4A|nr:potassium channel subfamily T member 1-like [Ylistrum balloti]